MYKLMRILGKIGIWLICPILILYIGVMLIVLIPHGGAAVRAFEYGLIASLVFAIPLLLCKVWDTICYRFWGSRETVAVEQQKREETPTTWTCEKCGAENSMNYGQCKKCGTFRTK